MSLMGRQRYDRSDGCRAARGHLLPVANVSYRAVQLTKRGAFRSLASPP